MLISLLVRNYALIEEVRLEFDAGLNIITGETGAGKSILLGAIQLLLGGRADKKQIYDVSKKCIAEANFANSDTILKLLEDHDLDVEDNLVIRRELSPSGKSRAFINDTPVSVAILREFGALLIDLNRQHELLDVQSVEFHYQLIDALANSKKDKEHYSQSYQTFNVSKKRLVKLKEEAAAHLKESNYLKFQLDEVEALELKEGDYASLESQLEKLSKQEDILRASQQSEQVLVSSEQAITDQLRLLYSIWNDLSQLDDTYASIAERILALIEESTDLASEIAGMDHNNADLVDREALEERYSQISQLLLKHQLQDANGLLELVEVWTSELSSSQDRDQEIKQIEEELTKTEQALRQQAKGLSAKRIKHFSSLENKVNALLDRLGMQHAKITVDHTLSDTLNQHGLDLIEILFSSNKGSDYRQIKSVASGGEMSRLMLCMKTIAAEKIAFPTLIFDEIDTGVSGEIAHKMGSMLKQISKGHQVIVITHSPQVAAQSNRHFEVFKDSSGERSLSLVRQLDESDKIEAIARMLSGNQLTETALENARDLIGVN